MTIEQQSEYSKITLENEDAVILGKTESRYLFVLGVWEDELGYEARVPMTREELQALRDLITETLKPTQTKLQM